eukprot:UC1_evm5s517
MSVPPAFTLMGSLCADSTPTASSSSSSSRSLSASSAHQKSATCVRFNRNGAYCVTGGRDRLLRLWNPHTQVLVKTYKGHSDDVNDAVATSDNARILTCSSDRCLILWDVATGAIVRRLRGHTSRVNCVALATPSLTSSRDISGGASGGAGGGNSGAMGHAEVIAFSGGYDATVRVWDLRAANTRDAMQILNDARDAITCLDYCGYELLAGSVDGRVRRYDVRAGRMIADFLGEPVTSACYSYDGHCVLAATLDSTVRLLDAEAGTLLQEYRGHTNTDFKCDARLTHHDANVVTGSEDGTVLVWDLVNGQVVQRLQAHAGTVMGVACHPQRDIMLTACVDGSVKVWGRAPK